MEAFIAANSDFVVWGLVVSMICCLVAAILFTAD